MDSSPHSGFLLHRPLILDRDWSTRDMRKTQLASSCVQFSKAFSDYQRTQDFHPNYLLSISAFLSKPSGYHTLISLQFNHLPTTNFHKFPFTSSVCLLIKGELWFVQAQISYIYNSDNSGLMLKWASLNLVFPPVKWCPSQGKFTV